MEKMEEIGIPSIVLLTKEDVLLPNREAKYKLVFGGAEGFWMSQFIQRFSDTQLV